MLLVDIEMPKNCSQCPLLHHGEYGAFEKSWCNLDGKIVISDKRRPSKCPIKAEIPDNATNGDVIKAIFPDVEIVDDYAFSYGVKLNDSNYIQFNKDWWNAPYKSESDKSADTFEKLLNSGFYERFRKE